MTFNKLGLIEPLIRAVKESGYSETTPIQSAAIPAVLEGKDLMASAQTGTGKTAAFTLPLLQMIAEQPSDSRHPRVLVITPTRELAAQILASVETYGRYLDVTSTVVFGGVNINPQMKKLRQGVDILVATPGRLLDLHNQKAVNLSEVTTLVLDEADRMLDMGFIHDIKRIQSYLRRDKQTLLFSATFSNDIRKLAKEMLINPIEIDVAPKNSTAENVSQQVFTVDKKQKPKLLSYLITSKSWAQVLVFTRTKHGANKLVKELFKDGIPAVAIHGNKSQSNRTKALADFKNGKVSILVATDIAARGIDILQLPQVVNFDLPHVPEDYIHRIGRTGRAGLTGQAVSLVCADEIKQLQDIERLIGKHIEREEAEGFEPQHDVPASRAVSGSSQRAVSGSSRRSASGSSQRSGNSSSQRFDKGSSQSASRTRSDSRSTRNGSSRSRNASTGYRGQTMPGVARRGIAIPGGPVGPDRDGNLKSEEGNQVQARSRNERGRSTNRSPGTASRQGANGSDQSQVERNGNTRTSTSSGTTTSSGTAGTRSGNSRTGKPELVGSSNPYATRRSGNR